MPTNDRFASLYELLKTLAARRLARLPPHCSLQAADLVHEVYARFLREGHETWGDTQQFLNASVRAMHNVLVDHARRRDRQKRGGGWERVSVGALGALGEHDERDAEDLVATGAAIERLAASSPEAAEIVWLRVFVGLTVPEIASLLDTSVSSVERRWRFARAWLRREIEGGEP